MVGRSQRHLREFYGKDSAGDTDLSTGGNPAAWASSPAPSGCRWDFVTFNGALVTRSGEPVVSLVRIN